MSQDMNGPDTHQTLPHFRSVALVAAGSNVPIGEFPLSTTIDRALEALRKTGGAIRAISRYFSTPAFPEGSGPDFVNAAFVWESNLTARQKIAALHDVEASMGRIRQDRWGARTIDLDLIALGDTVLPNEAILQSWMDLPLHEQQRQAPDELVLPHPRVQDRAFVLVPLCDVAPDWQHPILGRTATQMRDALPKPLLDSVKPLENREKRS